MTEHKCGTDICCDDPDCPDKSGDVAAQARCEAHADDVTCERCAGSVSSTPDVGPAPRVYRCAKGHTVETQHPFVVQLVLTTGVPAMPEWRSVTGPLCVECFAYTLTKAAGMSLVDPE